MHASTTPPTSKRKAIAFIGQCFALALTCFCIASGISAIYAAFHEKGGGEWEGVGDVFVFITVIPASFVALLLAIFCRPANTWLRATTIVLALIAMTLPFFQDPARQTKHRKYREQLDHVSELEEQRRLNGTPVPSAH